MYDLQVFIKWSEYQINIKMTDYLITAKCFGRAVSKRLNNRRMNIPLISNEVLRPLAEFSGSRVLKA
jgi:hypothetical protein